jgi:uncharacterized secreted protein with C-terminal beta-propeller domain|tara:strand:+ start:220 stop:495 length:276 start_codon:yes stop_codon:yes gene_type:complete
MKSYKTSLILALKEHVLAGKPITNIEAMTLFGVPSLTKEVADMRRHGYKIDSRKIPFVKVVRRINEYAVYVPPSNLPIKEITVTEYVWAGL